MTLVPSTQVEFEKRDKKAKRYLGKATRNAALGFLELYRIKQKELWQAGLNSEGEFYQTWEQYLDEFVFEVTNISRSKVFGRMRVIRRLEAGLGFGVFAIYRALQSPAATEDALNKLGVWVRGTGELKALKPGVEERIALPFTEDSPQELLSEVVSNAMVLPRGEGRRYVSEMAGELQIWGRLELAGGRMWIIIKNEGSGAEYQYVGPEPDDETFGWLERKFGRSKEG